MVAFWINYGSSLHITGNAQWQVPLAMQCLPPTLLFISMLFMNESPRWLARTDQWEKSARVLAHVRNLPEDHAYVQHELLEMQRQLEEELASVNGGVGFIPVLKEMFTVPGNRRRVAISTALMCAQQWTGTNAINYYAPTIFEDLGLSGNTVRCSILSACITSVTCRETNANPTTQTDLLATGVYGVVRTVRDFLNRFGIGYS